MISIVLIVFVLAIVLCFGMAKWTSVLFSDIRNKLGNQVVFTSWKGRGSIRAYVKPANPNTLKQQARRDLNREAVVNWQAFVGTDADKKGAWDEVALARQISGFNQFMQYAGKIKVESDETGTTGVPIDITYTCPIDISQMGLYYSIDNLQPIEMLDAGGLNPGDDQTAQLVDPPEVGTYRFFIGPAAVFAALAGVEKIAVCAAHWIVDETNGVADPAACVVTAP